MGAGPALPDQAKDLDREQAELALDITLFHSL